MSKYFTFLFLLIVGICKILDLVTSGFVIHKDYDYKSYLYLVRGCPSEQLIILSSIKSHFSHVLFTNSAILITKVSIVLFIEQKFSNSQYHSSNQTPYP